MRALSRGKGNAMEDFLTSFFITPFTSLGEGLAAATSPLDVIDAVDGFVWGPIMILLLLGTHIFMTIRTGFIQRKLGTGIKLSVTKDDPSDADGDITQFGALTTALAATIGTGNIVGVGTGLLFGGPGAILWMWITGILGIATKYSEVFIGVKYRVKDHSGKMLGGAMYALERGFKNKKLGRVLAVLFALFASLAAFGIGASTQSNSLADALYNTSLIDGAASLVHMMNLNTFTCGAFHVSDAGNVSTVAADIRSAVQGKQWMCGFPDKLVIFTSGQYVVSVYGNESLVNTFRDKFVAAHSGASTVYDEAIGA